MDESAGAHKMLACKMRHFRKEQHKSREYLLLVGELDRPQPCPDVRQRPTTRCLTDRGSTLSQSAGKSSMRAQSATQCSNQVVPWAHYGEGRMNSSSAAKAASRRQNLPRPSN